ncbi:hypothetical protein Btru_022463 [Bulinus truncatus]|nr:hypothetical protein Btru_022463 [Bulinus truncatus]
MFGKFWFGKGKKSEDKSLVNTLRQTAGFLSGVAGKKCGHAVFCPSAPVWSRARTDWYRAWRKVIAHSTPPHPAPRELIFYFWQHRIAVLVWEPTWKLIFSQILCMKTVYPQNWAYNTLVDNLQLLMQTLRVI